VFGNIPALRRLALLSVSLAARLGLILPTIADDRPLDTRVQAELESHGDGVEAGIWVGALSGEPQFTHKADAIFPTASAIKTAFLIELFARYADALDQPPPGLDAVLADTHPAVAHFTAPQREEIRKGLTGVSVRKLGGIMMGSVRASNIVYNAAANVTTALLGGPEALTRAIRARDPSFAPIAARRYMLAPRNVTGDNEATPAALAAVLKCVATDRTSSPTPKGTLQAVSEAMLTPKDHIGIKGRHHVKEGALDSDPLVRVHSGWVERDDGTTLVYVVMLTQPSPGKLARDKAGERLEATTRRITKMVVDAVAKR
jgi:hypothetical protein